MSFLSLTKTKHLPSYHSVYLSSSFSCHIGYSKHESKLTLMHILYSAWGHIYTPFVFFLLYITMGYLSLDENAQKSPLLSQWNKKYQHPSIAHFRNAIFFLHSFCDKQFRYAITLSYQVWHNISLRWLIFQKYSSWTYLVYEEVIVILHSNSAGQTLKMDY